MFPTHVGMNLAAYLLRLAEMEMFPTHVGMNRYAALTHPLRPHVPHTRGDEPVSRIGQLISLGCSPHTWG